MTHHSCYESLGIHERGERTDSGLSASIDLGGRLAQDGEKNPKRKGVIVYLLFSFHLTIHFGIKREGL